MAAYYGKGQLIDLLVQHGAVIDATDYLGQTPLHLACQRGYQNVVVWSCSIVLLAVLLHVLVINTFSHCHFCFISVCFTMILL
jgi:hypothetical protein